MESPAFQDREEVERALGAPRFLIFKHSLICPVSERAFSRYLAFLETHPQTPTAWVDVIGQRPLSQHIAARTGITHASPQAIVVIDGTPAWNASHDAITVEALDLALRTRESANDPR